MNQTASVEGARAFILRTLAAQGGGQVTSTRAELTEREAQERDVRQSDCVDLYVPMDNGRFDEASDRDGVLRVSGHSIQGEPENDHEARFLQHIPDLKGTDHTVTITFSGDSDEGYMTEQHSGGHTTVTIFTPESMDDFMVLPNGIARHTHVDRDDPESSYEEQFLLAR